MVIAAKAIPRWVQPAPTTTNGIAEIRLTGDPQAQVVGDGPASAGILAQAAVKAVAVGSAAILYDDDLALLTRVTASASVVFDNTAEVEDNLGVAAGIALLDFIGPGVLQTVHTGPVTLLIQARLDTAPQVSGDAEVSFADYGQGSVPIFPFKLPAQFTDNPLGIQVAAAEIVVGGSGVDVAGAGYADAAVAVGGSGLFALQGNTPIFPYKFPITFTDAANIQVAYAQASVTAPGELVADVDGDAPIVINAVVIQANPAVFPMTLPVVLA